jgi:hypothetical protein
VLTDLKSIIPGQIFKAANFYLMNKLLFLCALVTLTSLGCTNDIKEEALPAGQLTALVDGQPFIANEVRTANTIGKVFAFVFLQNGMLGITGEKENGDMIMVVASGVRGPGNYPLRTFDFIEDTIVNGGSQGAITIGGQRFETNDTDVGVLNVSVLDTAQFGGQVTATFRFVCRSSDGSTRNVTAGVANKVFLGYY